MGAGRPGRIAAPNLSGASSSLLPISVARETGDMAIRQGRRTLNPELELSIQCTKTLDSVRVQYKS